ncbi:MAG: hypothetical protein A2381_15180 [Bdellovibrionales bacterium RIFOXYB1_FULL_37_110]|nr:MAG: hypothetical protein A2381_15180 [Bdellovibrionales bacterium RIFOXYB1_FULL_37_110]
MDLKVKTIHAKSLIYGAAFKAMYWTLGKEDEITRYTLEVYRKTRRQIPGWKDPKTGRSTRYGANEAYESTRKD